jgi:hypothetical protein
MFYSKEEKEWLSSSEVMTLTPVQLFQRHRHLFPDANRRKTEALLKARAEYSQHPCSTKRVRMVYSDQQKQWLVESEARISKQELLERFNNAFPDNPSNCHNALINAKHRFSRQLPMPELTKQQCEWLSEEATQDLTVHELADVFSERYGMIVQGFRLKARAKHLHTERQILEQAEADDAEKQRQIDHMRQSSERAAKHLNVDPEVLITHQNLMKAIHYAVNWVKPSTKKHIPA